MLNWLVNLDDRDVLVRAALFVVPSIIDAGRRNELDPARITQTKLLQTAKTMKVTFGQKLANNILNAVPVSYGNAEKAIAVYNEFLSATPTPAKKLDQRSILPFVYRVKFHDELFSDSARMKYKIDPSPFLKGTGQAINAYTVDNFKNKGRLTEYMAKYMLETFQESYGNKFQDLSKAPKIVADFIQSKDLRDYLTTDHKAVHKVVRQNEKDEFFISKEDLEFLPEPWWDGR